jgi:5-formyltetrahydrofolate cyclo-ligase
MQNSRARIRKAIRLKRNELSAQQQIIAAQDTLSHLQQLPLLKSAQNIALYLSVDGELDTKPIINYLWSQGKSVYLPVLHPFSMGHLLFLKYDENTPLVANKFDILEPKLNQTLVIPIAQLDIIFAPLVAFDPTGQRLGMGGGYYDRSLESWFKTGKGATPIGIAHNCQLIDAVPVESWDIPLPTIITPNKVWQWTRASLGK